ncbi:MAG: 3-deoxy-7-phosphoheptulonate synthase [Planctomycetes bacterium]|nr:3-deoxy-7-phosphoheptulonate synthase [Planctomycetota bacterium]
MERTENLNIVEFKPLITPDELKRQLPATDRISSVVAQSRMAVKNILANRDTRRLVITGPCSLHDTKATLEYADKLAALQPQVQGKIQLVMRAYFEKPRTTLGWKGMIYDPDMDDSGHIEQGFKQARQLLLDISDRGLALATEFLDPIVPQYIADLISWASVGARTTESQIHRQMASGLSMPVGFKNSTEGSLDAAIAAVNAASSGHAFMGIDGSGQVVVAVTAGNPFGHLVLRGGAQGPNYGAEYVAFAQVLLQKAGVPRGLIIDCSHANSSKDHTRQQAVALDVAQQIQAGSTLIAGFMLESFLEAGNQKLTDPAKLQYGVSVTDKCMGWEESEKLIKQLADTI